MVRLFNDDFSPRIAMDNEMLNETQRTKSFLAYRDRIIDGKADDDAAAWLAMATCGRVWSPTSMFSLTAAVAAGASLHLEGRLPRDRSARRRANGTCAGFVLSEELGVPLPPSGVWLGFP